MIARIASVRFRPVGPTVVAHRVARRFAQKQRCPLIVFYGDRPAVARAPAQHLEIASRNVESPPEPASISCASIAAAYKELTVHHKIGHVSKNGPEGPLLTF
jgi:hypothetical protein